MLLVDFADFEIIGESVMSGKVRKVSLRCIASINDEGYIQESIVLVYPLVIDTNDKLAIHITQYVVSPWFESLKEVPEVITECPIDHTPLQNGECMVCGYEVI